ncbi:SH3 and multiple ankyrin repeat domains protein 2-like isoform X6 [Pseudomyrmex gracilis]|uniref:SH3 and multiple ankyrin repeat domains protein 2-like isoform X6 n=1 Tax=Pseudomyrmex gracilis TaxID=219809 RepID=UPI0009951418|nr:SH3 and multiple ankyrin repeat domains protein 2-like isoform X6 [Pseudomyrmex gracilis]
MEAESKQQQQPPQQCHQQQQAQQQQQQNSPVTQPQGQMAGDLQSGLSQGQQNAEDTLASAENTSVDEGVLLARIHVPELYVSKCLQFPKDQLVWDVKQQCLASLPKEVATWYRELKESFNYGLFCPPVNGKAGKFLDEERRLGDYPFNGPVGYLELKYKRRVYKMLHLDEKQLKAMHTRTNLRRLLDYVQGSQVEKIAKMCSKGLDPNFHCQETGETPLTLATTLKKPSKVIIALVNGGALLDYRTKEGLTAMHRAVERNNLEAVKTLLELGASPNYKDTKGLTPLYYSVIYKTDPMLCETLLHDHATIGAQDLQGWQEVHQACRNNLVQHLDHLLFYGADMNARNASGNTPLHVCAVNNTDASCIRQLLFRGAQKDALNYANQTPYQVAVIAGNMELAEVIKNYQPEEVDKSLGDTASDVISDSSGVGTSQSDTTNSLSIPGTTVVCVESYNSGITGHLTINQGDILEVTGATDCGLLEGVLRGQGTGLFPAHCVQEVRLRHTNIPLGPQPTRDGRNRVLGRRESQHKYFATAPRLKKPVTSEPRTVVLHRSRKGFGFVLRGAKATSPLMELTPSARYPALQYLDDVDQGGVADLAGLRKGDFLIQINGEDVTTASHEHVVDLIRKSGELVRMTVVSPVISLPNSQSAAALPTSQPIQRQYATLPRKGNNNVVIGGTLGRSPAPIPPRRDPKTTLSVGRARARSMVAGLEGGGERDERDDITSTGAKSSSAESIHMPQQSSTGSNTGQNTPVQPRTASIRSRPTSSRITAAELEELFQRQQGSAGGQYSSSMMSSSHFQTTGQSTKSHPSSPAKTGRVYASVAEMKRKGKSHSRVRFFGGLGGGSDLHRDFHSTPDLNVQVQSSSILAPKCHRSQEDVNAINGRNGLPPPNHPPPPPPVGQVVKVNVGPNMPDVVTPASVYDNMAHIQQVKELAAATVDGGYGVMSSFRPSNSAKLYASPEDMKTVGYRSRSLPAHTNRPHLRKSHSLRNTPSSTTFKPTSLNGSQQTLNTNVGSINSNGNGNNSANNQYAQPLKTNRSHSTAGIRERKKKTVVSTSSSVTNLSSNTSGTNGTSAPPSAAPPIPEPDYSLSESENDEGEDETDEDGESEIAKELEKAAAREKIEATKETSGNSNTSGSSSSGSGSLPHSFSVEEIQKVRTQLKSSKSHPNDFGLLQTQQSLAEDGDNSSSGVSSDQDVPVGPPMGFDDTAMRNLANQENSQNSIPSGGTTLMTGVSLVEKESTQIKRPGYGGSGLLTRHAVSLAQLPPPIEADAEEQNNDLFVPPPPEFNAGPSAGGHDQEVVFAPPPQFCDNKQQQQQPQQQQQTTTSQNRVKIIGAIPKVAGNQVKASGGRLP